MPRILSQEEIRNLAYALCDPDTGLPDDEILLRKLNRVGLTLGDYFDQANDTKVADEAIRIAVYRYMLPKLGLILKTMSNKAVMSADYAKSTLELIGKLSTIMEKRNGAATEQHLHIYQKMDDKQLIAEAKEQLVTLQRILKTESVDTKDIADRQQAPMGKMLYREANNE